MGDCNSCSMKNNCDKSKQSCLIKINPNSKIKNVIGVMSGKGGVGKSTVSVTLARELASKGYKVGVLDADITGPSVARLLGLGKDVCVAGTPDNKIIPAETEDGIKLISLNLMLDDENQPVIWRGSILSKCVSQFWEDVLWGELDYLVIDMPPGTGDVTLTIMQTIPLSGLIIVSVPQSMVSMIVTKSINMAKKMNVKIYGIVENMSYILCPHCNEKIEIYDRDEIEKLLKDNDLKLLAELPTTKGLANIYKGGLEQCEAEIKKQFENIINEITK